MKSIRPYDVVPLVAACAALSGGCSSSSTPSLSNDAAAAADTSSGSSGSSGGSGSSGSSSSSGSGSTTGATCGLTLFPPDFPSSCQTAADETCCTQEQACEASADCVNLVACINACPPPRQDKCLNACSPADGGAGPGPTLLTDIANCSKTLPADAGWSSSCNWPTN